MKITIKQEISKINRNRLIDCGNLINEIGFYRIISAHNNRITKKQLLDFFKQNQRTDNLSEEILEEIDKVWLETVKFLNKLGLLVRHSEDIIEIKDVVDEIKL